MTKEVTFTPEALQAVIAEAVAVALAAREAKTPTNKLVDPKTDAALRMDVLVCRAFKRSGFGEVVPRVDTKTYNKWLAEGWRVKPGERATRVKQFRLFHKTQVEFVGLPSKAEQQAEADAAKAATPAKPGIVARLKAKANNPAQPSLV